MFARARTSPFLSLSLSPGVLSSGKFVVTPNLIILWTVDPESHMKSHDMPFRGSPKPEKNSLAKKISKKVLPLYGNQTSYEKIIHINFQTHTRSRRDVRIRIRNILVDEGIFDQLELLHLNVFTATSSDYIYLRIVCFFFRTGELLYLSHRGIFLQPPNERRRAVRGNHQGVFRFLGDCLKVHSSTLNYHFLL